MPAPSQSSTAARIERLPLNSTPDTTALAPISLSRSTPASPPDNTSGLAHDAGNLLGALRLYSDLLNAAGVLRPEHSHYATELRLISDRSSVLIDRLLSLPAATAHDEIPRPPPADLATSLRQLHALLNRIASPSARVDVLAPAALACSQPCAEVVERIVLNLVCNAAEAMAAARAVSDSSPASHRKGCIQVTLALVGYHLHLEIADDGPGIPLAAAAAFLKPSAAPDGARHGHGHRIVHQLACSSGATVAVRIRPGRGTTFCFDWPLPVSSRPQTPQPGNHDHRTGASRAC